jgi:hypothetical protein
MADYFGYTTNRDTWLGRLETRINTKIDDQRAEGTDCLSTIDNNPGDQSNANGCLYTGSLHDELSGQFYGMVPELGRILRDWATTASSNIASWVYRNAQGFYLVNQNTHIYEGEVPKAWYVSHQAFFHVLSDVQAVDFASHVQMVDSPACKADVYYIERLVRAIEASGNANWVNYQQTMNGVTEGSIGKGISGTTSGLSFY